jgi:hypothetical protein
VYQFAIRGRDSTIAMLNETQFKIVRFILVDFDNKRITREQAEAMITSKLKAAGVPLIFKEI